MLLNTWGPLNTWEQADSGGTLEGRGFMADFVHGLRKEKDIVTRIEEPDVAARDLAEEIEAAKFFRDQLLTERKKLEAQLAQLAFMQQQAQALEEISRLKSLMAKKAQEMQRTQEIIVQIGIEQARLELMKRRQEEEEIALIIAFMESH